jgi:hypothetical protein
LSIISSECGDLTVRKLPGSYWRQIGGSICAQISSLPYQENHLLVSLTFPELVLGGLEQ